MIYTIVVVGVVVPLYGFYVLVLSQHFTRPIQLWWLLWWYHSIGIMCWYCTRASDDIYYGYSCGTTVLVFHSVLVLVLVPPL